MFNRQAISRSYEESDVRKKSRKPQSAETQANNPELIFSNGLNMHQQTVMRMQQTQGNAAVRRMVIGSAINRGLGVVQRDEKDNVSSESP